MPEYLLLLLLLRYPEFEYPDPGPSEFDSEAKAEQGREKKLEEKKKERKSEKSNVRFFCLAFES